MRKGTKRAGIERKVSSVFFLHRFSRSFDRVIKVGRKYKEKDFRLMYNGFERIETKIGISGVNCPSIFFSEIRFDLSMSIRQSAVKLNGFKMREIEQRSAIKKFIYTIVYTGRKIKLIDM